MRVGETYTSEWGESTAWKHAQCAFPPGRRHPLPQGLGSLRAADSRIVQDLCAGRSAAPLALAPSPTALPAPTTTYTVSVAQSPRGAAAAEPSGDADDQVCLATLDSSIVGVRYYAGVAHVGEYMTLVREPRNPYDSNAIRVDNLHNVQVGHLPRGLAAVLAPLVDGRHGAEVRPLLEAEIRGSSNGFNMPVAVSIVGTANMASTVRLLFARFAVPVRPGSGLAAPPAAAASPQGGAVTQRVRASALAPSSQEDLDRLMEQEGSATTKADRLVPFDGRTCAGALLTQLMPHQATGVAWMLSREADTGLPPFWRQVTERGRSVYINDITNSSQDAAPTPVSGGLLSDDMGLGKSLMVLTTILANRAATLCDTGASAGDAGDEDFDDLSDLSLKQLQAAAKKLRVPVSGTKQQLVSKIQAARASAAAGAGPSTATASGEDARATLIVCPVSVMSNWEEQLREHVRPGALKSYVYAGTGRIGDAQFLGQQDVVIVSYSTLAAELTDDASGPGNGAAGKRKRTPQGLFSVSWRRIVLDEAHNIRNRSTRAYAAAMALRGRFRWAVTGTPISNKADDAQPLFAFIRAAPLSDWPTWQRAVGRPLKAGDITGLARLRTMLTSLALRRTKALLGNTLPPKTIEVHVVRMDATTREVYDVLFTSARAAVAAATAAGGDDALLGAYTPVLECLMRLRQACNDAALVPQQRLEAARRVLASLQAGAQHGNAAITGDEAKKLFAALSGALGVPPGAASSSAAAESTAPDADAAAVAEDCSMCYEALSSETLRLLRACRHAFCESCITNWASVARTPNCPLCRTPFAAGDILSKALIDNAMAATTEGAAAAEAQAAAKQEGSSSASTALSPKILALLTGLTEMRTRDGPTAKCVVFSQFTSFLTKIQAALASHGHASVRLDGSMSSAARSAALEQWRVPNAEGGPAVLCCSTRAGGVGLNLTAGNCVFMMDPWWSAAAEEQAMDRVHRLGQTKPVYVVRYACERTVEQKMLKLQEAKAALGRGALTKLTAEEQRAARAADLRDIFEL